MAAGRVADFVLGVVFGDEVLHYGAGFEKPDGFPVGEGVGEGGDAAVGVDGEEPGFFLGVLRDVDFVDFVGETR